MVRLIALLLVACGGQPVPAGYQPSPTPTPTPSTPSAPSATTPSTPVTTPPPITAFAEPPQQRAPWVVAKTKLDAAVTAAMTRLFDQGFADPRGCDYREIEIDVTAGMDDAATRTKTHGWVLPGSRLAIAWNGLVYQAHSIGAAANVTTDIRAMLDAHRKSRDEVKRDIPDHVFYFHPSVDEGHNVQPLSLAPGKAMMLLRLGDAALAETVWTTAIKDQPPYAVLADDWLWAQFVRGAGAHRRGEVALAIENWRRLPALAKVAGKEFPNGAYYLRNIDALFADEQRRAAHPKPPFDLRAVAKLPTAERVAQLIEALDQVSVSGFAGQDPIVTALIAERDAAMGALFTAYETDERFTRTRTFDFKRGDSARHRHIIPVHEIAHLMLIQVIDTSLFQATPIADADTTSPAARRALSQQLRAHYQKWKSTSPLLQRYQTFADDTADENRWLIAALQLTARDATKQLAGESLRSKTPTVTSLFVRRLGGFSDFRERARMLEAFAAWDAPAAKPFLAKTVRDGFANWSAGEHRGMDPYLGEALVGLTTARIAAGDTTALREYAAWIATTLPEHAQFAVRRWFAPMMAHPRDPVVVRAATTLFTSSPWVPLTTKRSGFYNLELLGSELIKVAAFRDHAISQLSNRAKLGTMKARRGGIEIRTDAFQTGESVDAGDPHAPKEGWTDTLRVCDQYAASLLSGRTGVPVFRRYWPAAERDRALVAITAWLRTQ